MHFLEYFYKRILKYELINKFSYKNSKNLPIIKKIVLNFSSKNPNIKILVSNLLAFNLITNQKGILTTTKKSNIALKIKKGNPIGCKITLRNKKIFYFLSNIIITIFPKIKNFNGLNVNKKLKTNYFSYQMQEILNFSILEKNYYLFNNLNSLKVTIIIKTCLKKEIMFIFKSLQFSIKN